MGLGLKTWIKGFWAKGLKSGAWGQGLGGRREGGREASGAVRAGASVKDDGARDLRNPPAPFDPQGHR